MRLAFVKDFDHLDEMRRLCLRRNSGLFLLISSRDLSRSSSYEIQVRNVLFIFRFMSDHNWIRRNISLKLLSYLITLRVVN